MEPELIFLSIVILGPNSLGRSIDVFFFFLPLVDKLNQLWSFRTLIYDIKRKQTFQMKATLMWTINNFPVYEMVSS